MTVAELIAELSALPGDLVVHAPMEGYVIIPQDKIIKVQVDKVYTGEQCVSLTSY